MKELGEPDGRCGQNLHLDGLAESRDWWPRYGAKVQQYLAQHLTVPKELDLEFRKAELATETFLIWCELLASAAQRLHEADMPPESEEADELFNEAAELYRSLLWELPLFSQLDEIQLSNAYQEQLSFNKDRSQRDTRSFIIRTYFTLSDACRHYDCPGQARGFFRQVFADWPTGKNPTDKPLDAAPISIPRNVA